MARLTHNPDVFEVPDETAAKAIILTPEFGLNTETRWQRETPYLTDLIAEQIAPKAGGLYLDYGGGIGRLSKAMIERFDCRVLCVDLSQKMRALAPDYVQSPSFSAISPHILYTMAQNGFRADGAISVWVLQHSPRPEQDGDLLKAALKPGGRLFLVNQHRRAVPTKEHRWTDDGQDIRKMLQARLEEVAAGALDPDIVTPEAANRTYWATFARSG